ncbi:hypothetical protein L6452_31337 [Arctium lappa]|uniref:Uncharacterized protein n=1 Tax=Arctium lappa TaxID=4217 RepID=A0ACB8ZKJ2_ARCLA|nr:hypothetical protein L6452_31337 [Arctium lappa]
MAIIFFFFVFFVFLTPPTTAARNPLPPDDLITSAGYGDQKLSTVLVTGSLLCDACLDGNSPLQSHPIPGASMAVSCGTSRKTSKSDWVRGITDVYGDFVIDLPSHLHALPNMEKRCILRILQLPKTSPCHQAFTGEYRGIKFSSAKNGFRTYTARDIHLTPKHPQACMHIKSRGKMVVHTF